MGGRGRGIMGEGTEDRKGGVGKGGRRGCFGSMGVPCNTSIDNNYYNPHDNG